MSAGREFGGRLAARHGLGQVRRVDVHAASFVGRSGGRRGIFGDGGRGLARQGRFGVRAEACVALGDVRRWKGGIELAIVEGSTRGFGLFAMAGTHVAGEATAASTSALGPEALGGGVLREEVARDECALLLDEGHSTAARSGKDVAG